MEVTKVAIFEMFIKIAIGWGIIIGTVFYFTEEDYVESKTLIVPEIKLTTNGNKVDTLYIYKFK